MAANVGPWLHARAVVVTFDRYGASGHANHVAVYHGAAPRVGKKASALLSVTARRVDGVKGDGWRKARRTRIKQLARQDGLPVPAAETAPHHRRYIGALDVACAAVRALDPRPCGPGVLEAPSMACRVPRVRDTRGGDGVRGAGRVRDTVAAAACGVPRECTHRSVLAASLDAARLLRGARGARVALGLVPAALRRLLRAPTYANRLVASSSRDSIFLRAILAVLTNAASPRIRSAAANPAAAIAPLVEDGQRPQSRNQSRERVNLTQSSLVWAARPHHRKQRRG